MENKLTPAEIVIAAGGAVAFIASFLTFYGEDPFTINGWDEFPLFTYPALFGLIAAGAVLLQKLANVDLPKDVLGFNWNQLYLVLGLFATLVALGIFIAGEDSKIGLILTLLGSIAMLVGGVMLRSESATSSGGGGGGGGAPF